MFAAPQHLFQRGAFRNCQFNVVFFTVALLVASVSKRQFQINYREQRSIISSIGINGVAASFIIEGAVDCNAFNTYVEQVLRPTIKASDILVLDNLTAHHASRIAEVAAECTDQVLWLAPYSPDFSPIELLWSKITTGLRKAKARTIAELSQALNKGLGLNHN